MVSLFSALAAAFAVTSAAASTTPTTDSSSRTIANLRNEPLLRRLSSTEQDAEDADGGAFLDGAETVYDDYALAWRFLGFYTDCNVCLDDNDSDDYEYIADNPSGCAVGNNGRDTTVCRRYAMWAAYVDEGYEGNGADEYKFYDRATRRWNGCDKDDDEQRCVKMDCHNPYSRNFKLIGVFKDPKTDTFVESLIDYGGDCVWNDDEYKLMTSMNTNDNNEDNDGDDDGQDQKDQAAVAYWPPTKCTAYENDDDKTVYYYNAVPMAGGNLGVGLFQDDTCEVPVDLKKDRQAVSAEEILGRARGVTVEEKERRNDKKHRKAIAEAATDQMKAWNSAMDAFKVCQPCVSYDARLLFDDAEGTASAAHDQTGNRYGDNNFVCRDNLDQNEPINQCQVLVQNGRYTMKPATYRDVLLAESQGVVTGIDMAPAQGDEKGRRHHLVLGEPFVRPKHTGLSIILLLLSGGYFAYALTNLFEKDRSKNADRKRKRQQERERKLMALERQEQQTQASDSSTRQPRRKWSLKKTFSRSRDGSESRGDDSTRYSRM